MTMMMMTRAAMLKSVSARKQKDELNPAKPIESLKKNVYFAVKEQSTINYLVLFWQATKWL